VGITGLTTYDQYGTPEHGRQPNRRDFRPHPINTVAVRKWPGRDYRPGGKTVFLTKASVAKPLQPFDDDDPSLIENCCIKATKQQWDLGYPPQKSDRAGRVHMMLTLLLSILATAYRLPCEREALGGSLEWHSAAPRRMPRPVGTACSKTGPQAVAEATRVQPSGACGVWCRQGRRPGGRRRAV
jgi:hypothetical protein